MRFLGGLFFWCLVGTCLFSEIHPIGPWTPRGLFWGGFWSPLNHSSADQSIFALGRRFERTLFAEQVRVNTTDAAAQKINDSSKKIMTTSITRHMMVSLANWVLWFTRRPWAPSGSSMGFSLASLAPLGPSWACLGLTLCRPWPSLTPWALVPWTLDKLLGHRLGTSSSQVEPTSWSWNQQKKP